MRRRLPLLILTHWTSNNQLTNYEELEAFCNNLSKVGHLMNAIFSKSIIFFFKITVHYKQEMNGWKEFDCTFTLRWPIRLLSNHGNEVMSVLCAIYRVVMVPKAWQKDRPRYITIDPEAEHFISLVGLIFWWLVKPASAESTNFFGCSSSHGHKV